VREAARHAGIEDRIIWLGWIDPSEVGRIAAGCELALHPFDDTPVNRAKCSVKLLELMATGIPVISTAVGENRSYIEDGTSGRLAASSDAAELAAAVLELLTRPERGRELGAAARERVERRFLWEYLAPTAENAYRKALGPAGRSR
jgi:glycosyltransferase involved in cell wall biosynthesis